RERPSPRPSGRPSSPADATDVAQHFAAGAAPFLIAGPCVVESDQLNLRIGAALAELGAKLEVHVIYKASYDKANRSRLAGARGPGLERGLEALARVRADTGLPILTDVHEASQVSAVAQVADVLQIPAFLCRQTDLLVAAGRGPDGASGGLRESIPPLLYAAAAAGADGFFIETHPDPDRAPSDGPNMVPLDQLTRIMTIALDVWHATREMVRA